MDTMNQSSQHNPVQQHHPAPTEDGGVSRRRLMRAGLATAPVLATLKSNTVLAGGHSCIRPSSFSSLALANWKVSAGRSIQSDFKCESARYWQRREDGLPRNFKSKTQFLSSTTGFTQNPNGAFSNLTLQQVLELDGNRSNAELARHVAAAYLSALSVNDDSSRVWLTRRQCRAIWNGQGNWSPFAGANWTQAQTMDYFDKVYSRSFVQ